jgi:TRAP-type C4-dicarboxylate transport system permease small subunit
MMEKQTEHGTAQAVPLLERLLTPLVRLCGAISALLVLILLALTACAIFMRYFMNKPLVWGDQLLGYLLVAFVMLGLTEAYRNGTHISIDMVVDKLQGRLNRLRWIWSDFCVLLLALVVGISTYESISFARLFGSYSSGAIQIQTWVPQVPVLLGAGLMGLFALTRLIGRLFQRD